MYPGKSGCILEKVVVIGQNWFYSGKRRCNRANCFYSGKSGCTLAKWLYSGKSDYIRERGCIREEMVVFGQNWFVLGQEWLYSGKRLYSGKNGCIRA